MRSRSRSEAGSHARSEERPLELVRVRRSQRRTRDESGNVRRRSRRRGGRGRGRGRPPAPHKGFSFWAWLRGLFGGAPRRAPRAESLSEQEAKVIAAFQHHYRLTFSHTDLLKLALTHRSYLSVTGQGPRESNERLEFLGDSVLGLVTSEFLYRENPTEHEGQLTKTKSLLVSKAILSRRALAMGLGRFVLMSHSEVESGGRQRLSILADAFESVVGAIYLDQGFEAARHFIHRWLLQDSDEIVADKRHTNYKSHLQEYVQSTFHTHPVYRIRGEAGPDHSKHFQVEVMVGKRVLGEGRGRNKKEAEQAAARDALERLEAGPGRRPERTRTGSGSRERREAAPPEVAEERTPPAEPAYGTRRSRRGGRRAKSEPAAEAAAPAERPEPRPAPPAEDEPLMVAPSVLARIALPEEPVEPEREVVEVEPPPPPHLEDMIEDLGRPEGPLEERRVDPFAFDAPPARASEGESWGEPEPEAPQEAATVDRAVPEPPPVAPEETSPEEQPVEVVIEEIIESEAETPHEPPWSGAEAGETEPPESPEPEAGPSPEASEPPAPAYGRRGRRRGGRR